MTWKKLLVANRGEIARRILRSARSMGLGTVAVYSEADRNAPHVADADEAVCLGGFAASESYLDIARVVGAAKASGAEAVHPGYGFLAENAAFAEAVRDAGLVFVGPSPEVIRDLGSKQRAKELATLAGVPVVPGYSGANQETPFLRERALEVGFPLLIKASAGGGGKGMRIVREPGELTDAIEAAKREAERAFGDATLLIERYVEQPRHIEVQIFGDAQGNVVHLFERECSIQRRHQKIIEETPSPVLTPELRARICGAAVALGKAVGYRSAGTVEFILSPAGEFFFLEVNTRLQVEHPVTEEVTGLDLVREQLRVAQGLPLSFEQEDLTQDGAAIECRLYAEDASHEFLPTTGRVLAFAHEPAEGLRVDAGIETGSEVGIHYDPMLAKVITWGTDRAEATARMLRALGGLRVHGLTTNRRFLRQVLGLGDFVEGRTDTHFIERNRALLGSGAPSAAFLRGAALALGVTLALRAAAARSVLPSLTPGYRNSPSEPEWVELGAGDATIRVTWFARANGAFDATVDGEPVTVRDAALSPAGDSIALEANGQRRRYWVTSGGEHHSVQSLEDAADFCVRPRFPVATAERPRGALTAPMPGKVVQLRVAAGDKVSQGQVLVVLEAMKMEHTVRATEDGEVARVDVVAGQQVDADALLVVVTPAAEA